MLILALKNPHQVHMTLAADEIKDFRKQYQYQLLNTNYLNHYVSEYLRLFKEWIEASSCELILHLNQDVISLGINKHQEKILITSTSMINQMHRLGHLQWQPQENGQILWLFNSEIGHDYAYLMLHQNHYLSLYQINSKQNINEKNYHLRFGFEIKQTLSSLADRPINVYSTMDFQQSLALLGEKFIRGIEASFSLCNTNGGIHGRYLKLNCKNDNYNPQQARKNIEAIIAAEKPNPPILLGPIGTPTLEAYADLIREEKLLVLFPFTGSSLLRQQVNKNIVFFRKSYNDEGRILVETMIEQYQLKKIAILYQDDSYGQPIVAHIQEQLNQVDHLLLPYLRNFTNIEVITRKINDYCPDGILFLSTPEICYRLIQRLGLKIISEIKLFSISLASIDLQEKLRPMGLRVVRSHVSPSVHANIPLVKYFHEQVNNNILDVSVSEDTLHGFIIAQIFQDILLKLDEQINPENILKLLETYQHTQLLGLPLHFDAHTRELYHNIWLDQEGENNE